MPSPRLIAPRALAFAVAALLAPAALAAPPAAKPTAPAKPAKPKAEVTCPFVTLAEVNALGGGTAVKVKRQDPDNGIACVFVDARAAEVASVLVQPGLPDGPTFVTNTKKWLAKIYPKEPIAPIPSLGEAFWAPKPGYVMVRKGDQIVTVKARGKAGTAGTSRPISETLTTKVLPKVK